MIAKVAVEKTSFSKEGVYDYLLPKRFEKIIDFGSRVAIPFGKNNALRRGIVMEIDSKESLPSNLKEIFAVLDLTPLIPAITANTIKLLAHKYFCSYYDVACLFFPCGIGFNVADIPYKADLNLYENSKSEFTQEETKFLDIVLNSPYKGVFKLKHLKSFKIKNSNKILISLISKSVINQEFEVGFRANNPKTTKRFSVFNTHENFSELKLTSKQKNVMEYLAAHESALASEVKYFTGAGASVLNSLVKKGVVSEFIHEEKNPEEKTEYNLKFKKAVLNEKQQEVFNSMVKQYENGVYKVSLLHGVTGSGKTQVCLKLMEYVMSQGKSAVFMVPEIALTDSFISLFKSYFPGEVEVLHSKLSGEKRIKAWNRIKEGKAKVVLGTRLCIFAPVNNLGIVIVDEEHEFTYKSESSPRFNAKEVAKILCKQSGASLVLASATPSVETYYMAKTGKYLLHEMKQRYAEARFPSVEIIDMNSQGEALFSFDVINRLKKILKENKQAIILINRRGYSPFVRCKNCGQVQMCPHCSVSLNYHKTNGRLMCHYCGYSAEFSSGCLMCKEKGLYCLGPGSQKAEDELKKLIPGIRILRMDSDSKYSQKSPRKKMLHDFSAGEYDVLVGTQMIAKGFNFPNVTFVAVLMPDQLLYSGDFRSGEKTFSLITQAIGRGGRSIYPAEAVIQTFTPENKIFEMAANQDYNGFFKEEINIRKLMLSPPFADICMIVFKGACEQKVSQVCSEFFLNLKKTAKENYKNIPLRIFSPMPAAILKVSDNYRYKIIIKCRADKNFRNMIYETMEKARGIQGINKISIAMDINPNTIL